MFATEFMDYLRHRVEDTIWYNEKGGDGSGQFVVEGTNFKKAKIVDSKIVFPRYKTSIKVSDKIKKKHLHGVKQTEITNFKDIMRKFTMKAVGEQKVKATIKTGLGEMMN